MALFALRGHHGTFVKKKAAELEIMEADSETRATQDYASLDAPGAAFSLLPGNPIPPEMPAALAGASSDAGADILTRMRQARDAELLQTPSPGPKVVDAHPSHAVAFAELFVLLVVPAGTEVVARAVASPTPARAAEEAAAQPSAASALQPRANPRPPHRTPARPRA